MDCNFPVIRYDRAKSPMTWGQEHGEHWRSEIAELVDIRTGLMREKNPLLNTDLVNQLAMEQWEITKSYHADLADELTGISQGSGASIVDLVVLNNYTDFRDIQPVEDQGCSLVFVNTTGGPIVGQTWDMHGSAKRFVCVLEVPLQNDHSAIVFSLVGCLGMMGFNTFGNVLGVNNINTDQAQAGVLWPTLVRHVVEQPDQPTMISTLKECPKTSGHNYLISDGSQAEMWEVCPGQEECVSRLDPSERGFIFHTNHCMGSEVSKRETSISQNSTTYIRHDLLEKKLPSTHTFDDVYNLMNDHEGYPKSICSNFQTNAQDPSITCGGAVGHLETGKIVMWRGDKLYDDNFVEHEFQLDLRN